MGRLDGTRAESLDLDQIVLSLRECVDALAEKCVPAETPSISNYIETKQLGEVAEKCLAARGIRDRYLPADLLGEPGWDMLLYLYASHAQGKRTCVSSCCYASGVPATTALRWLDKLEACGMIKRHYDEVDTRRRIVELSFEGLGKMAAVLRRMTGFARFEA